MKSIFAFILCLVLIGIANAQAQLKPPTEAVMDRFLRYVKIDTQSQEDQTTTPSTRTWTADAELVYRWFEFPRQVGIQLASRIGEVYRDAGQPGSNICGKELATDFTDKHGFFLKIKSVYSV